LLQDKIEIAGVGRPLTKQEQAQGLVAKPLVFEKIAIIVSNQNPFANGNITLKQFAQIYRGEIQDWSQVSRAKGRIVVVDRPDISDIRQSFAKYPAFSNGVKTGNNVVKLTEDSAKAVADHLGKDGIGYITFSQLKNLTGVSTLSIDRTQPDNIRYPFSQAIFYVYNKNKISEGAKALLGFVDSAEGAAAIDAASNISTMSQETSEATVGNSTAKTVSGWLILSLCLVLLSTWGGLIWLTK
jgi:phosphate transport system substrate-binding protein